MKIGRSGTVCAEEPLENTRGSQVYAARSLREGRCVASGPSDVVETKRSEGCTGRGRGRGHHSVQAGAVLAVRPQESHWSRPQPSHLCGGEHSPPEPACEAVEATEWGECVEGALGRQHRPARSEPPALRGGDTNINSSPGEKKKISLLFSSLEMLCVF